MGVCATGYPGGDDNFVRDVAGGRVRPTRVGLSDERGGAELVMIEFDARIGCQIHLHVQPEGEIFGHIKSNAGDRHSIYSMDCQLILDQLQIQHGNAGFDMTYR